MTRTAIYAGTRNLYKCMVVCAKSLLHHHGADHVIFLIEDDAFPEPLPDCISTYNVQHQRVFTPTGPNYNCRYTYMVLMRCAITKFFPDLDKALVLDCDTLVVKPIDDLWNIDLTDYYFALVEEAHIKHRPHPYFNFGVALHNLAKLRADGMDDIIIKTINHQPFDYCEQDVVNSLCRRWIYALDPVYNSISFNTPKVPPDQERIQHHVRKQDKMPMLPYYQQLDKIPWDMIGKKEMINNA